MAENAVHRVFEETADFVDDGAYWTGGLRSGATGRGRRRAAF
jgi:hypothetical protein